MTVLALRLATRLRRSKGLRPGSAAIAVFASLVLTMYVLLSALSLSGAQVADRDLGRFGAFVGYGSVTAPPGDTLARSAFETAAAGAGAVDPLVALVATDVQITEDPRTVWPLTEAMWSDTPFPRRYALLDGRWPAAPGEIVVSDAPEGSGRIGTRLAIFNGSQDLLVVGRADDLFASSPAALAGVGTWALVPPGVRDRYTTATAQPVLYWSGNDVAAVTAALERAVSDLPGGEVGVVEGSLADRAQVERGPEMSWLERSPAGYRIPSVLLPLLAVATLYGSQGRRARLSMRALRDVGIRRLDACVGSGLATASWALPAYLAGSAAGIGIGIALRPAAGSLRDRPTGPLPDLVTPIATGFLLTACAVTVGAVLLGKLWAPPRRLSGRQNRRGRGRRGALRSVRQTFGWGVLALTAPAALLTDSPADAATMSAFLTLGILLTLPELVGLSLRLLPEKGPRARLARRQMVHDRAAVTTGVGLTTFLLSASLGYTALFGSLVTSFNLASLREALPGQIIVQDRSSIARPPAPAALAVIADAGVGRTARAVPIGYSQGFDSAEGTETVVRVADGGTVIVVPDVAAVEGLLARELEGPQRRAIAAGGILVWDVPIADGRTVLTETATPGRTRQLGVPAITTDPPRVAWAAGSNGILLLSTAQELSVPVTTGPIAFLGVSDEQLAAVRRQLLSSGVDAATVLVPRDPPPVIPQAGFVVTVVGLAATAVAGAVMSTRSQVRALRGWLRRLQSVGLPRSWTRAVLFRQIGHVALTSTVLALCVAFPPLLASANNISGFVLDVPYREMLTFTLTVYAAMAAAAVLAARRLSGDPAAEG